MAVPQITIPKDEIIAFSRRGRVTELALFGSVLRVDFRPDSDVDVLVVFEDTARWSLWDLVEMHRELEAIFGRKVDLIERDALRNPFRRKSVLRAREVIYAAG